MSSLLTLLNIHTAYQISSKVQEDENSFRATLIMPPLNVCGKNKFLKRTTYKILNERQDVFHKADEFEFTAIALWIHGNFIVKREEVFFLFYSFDIINCDACHHFVYISISHIRSQFGFGFTFHAFESALLTH